ncbi:Alanyl-tRNA synthetase, cytoplasmic [Apis cerana cerana]|uniref:alanine--tRNA ligase n=1 Tax=Apis cerana cerana TaxID=94128 RepID=A0A2A3E8H9_APICC|nr:Alanyl-tRNA synthetase, cytoplasmic [Apis cerana cerana]
MNCILLTRVYNSSFTIQKSANLIRNEFLDYFKKDLEHTFIRSSPVISFNDHTIAFVNAGMNQFKGIFLNYYDSPAMKVTNSQKCIRISGKHNDLNIVGNDSYHHTFFEMLGNWSFGSYFKEEACRYAWNLLTKHYGIKEEFLYVTYFNGDEKLELKPDLECKEIWLNIGVKKDKILPFGLQENFWEMGISGPCGPCTEIHVDHTKQLKNRCMQINKGYRDLTELWNIVFIQYERLPSGAIIPLSKHYVDTGMGFERLVAVLQEKQSNYDTDIFQPFFKAIQKCTKAPEYKGTFSNTVVNTLDSGYRILADHSRMITVSLADGVIPEQSNKLRKIIRKSIDVSEKIFKKEKILSELSYIVVETLGNIYPELQNNIKKIQKIIEHEEELYKRLKYTSSKQWIKLIKTYPQLSSITEWLSPGLRDGYKYLQNIHDDLKVTKVLPGSVSFKLYDTYGLNIETIKELAEIECLYFDEVAFYKELENLKSQSRIGLEKSNLIDIKKSLEILEKSYVPKTDDSFKYKYVFNGNSYEFPKIESKILALIINESNKDEIGIILDKTVCYSLKDGQISDKGSIYIQNLIFDINNVKKINGYVIHYGKFSHVYLKKDIEKLKIGDNCLVCIEPKFRIETMQHHTATHLLHAIIQQKMQAVYLRHSLVFPYGLKCQFNSFGEKLSSKQLKEIEEFINTIITANVPVTTKILNAMELLAEDSVTLIPGQICPYKDIRVIEINFSDLKSKETCCGTHILKTAELEYFCFLNYSSKGASNFILKAIVGSLAKTAKMAGKNMQYKILDLENKLKNRKITCETFKTISKEIENELKNEDILIPYFIKEECLTKLNDLNKIIHIQKK